MQIRITLMIIIFQKLFRFYWVGMSETDKGSRMDYNLFCVLHFSESMAFLIFEGEDWGYFWDFKPHSFL